MKKRILAAVLALGLALSPAAAWADVRDNLAAQNEEDRAAVSAANAEIERLQAANAAIDAQIAEADAGLSAQAQSADDAAAELSAANARVETANANAADLAFRLEEAKAETEARRNEAKESIKYLYENTFGACAVEQIFSGGGAEEYKQKVEAAEAEQEQDLEALAACEEAEDEIEAMQEALGRETEELIAQQQSVQSEKDAVDAQYNEAAGAVTELQGQKESNDALIAEKQKEVSRLENLIATREGLIAEIDASGGENTEYTTEQLAAIASASTGAEQGEAIITYACQFLGCPYVWGGYSLTEGCDCSHFVYLCLKNCGAYSGKYMTSGYWADAGEPVASLEEARAGDVIVYDGHVAFYDGEGLLVEAKGSAWGITHDRRADSKPIVAIRRFT